MKKTLSLVAIIIIIIAATPFITGLVAKNRFENLAAQIQLQNPNLKLNTHYHLGWLSSRATVNWGLNSATEEPVPALQHEIIIHHGPIAVFQGEDGRTHFFLGIAVINVQLPQFAPNPMFSIHFQKKVFSNTIRIPFNLHYDIRLHARLQATVNVANKPLLNLNLDDLLLKCNFTHNLSRVQGQFLVDNFNITGNSIEYLNIPKIEVQINHHTEQGVYLGNEAIRIPSIDLSLPNMLQFKMQMLTAAFTGTQDKDNVTYQMVLGVSNALYNEAAYGPFAFDLQISNLNFKALSQIQQKIQDYVKAKAAQPDNADALQNDLEQALRPLLPTLIQANTELTLKQLDFSIPSGSLRSNGYLRFSQRPTALDVSALLQSTELHYHLAANQDLTQDLIQNLLDRTLGLVSNTLDPAQILTQLMQIGLIKESNGFYNVDIAVKRGAPYVNDQPFNPAVLQQIQLTAPEKAAKAVPAKAAAK